MGINIGNEQVIDVTIDGEFVEQITVDGDKVFDGVFESPQQIQQFGLPNGYYKIKTSTGSSEFYVNTEDHSDSGWILASNFDVRGNNYASDNGYSSPTTLNEPRTSGDVESNYINTEGAIDESGPLAVIDDFNGASPVNGSYGVPTTTSGSPIFASRSFRPDIKNYSWNEIKIKMNVSGGNDGWSDGQGRNSSGGEFDLFGNSLDGIKVLAGEPNSSRDHIWDIVTNNRDSDNPNYTQNNVDIIGSDNFVSNLDTPELTYTISFNTTIPPLVMPMVDQGNDDEGFTIGAAYIWIR